MKVFQVVIAGLDCSHAPAFIQDLPGGGIVQAGDVVNSAIVLTSSNPAVVVGQNVTAAVFSPIAGGRFTTEGIVLGIMDLPGNDFSNTKIILTLQRA